MIAKETAHERLAEIAELEANWDSYDAYPIDPRAIENARRLIDEGPDLIMWVCPLPNGGVQIEYLPHGKDDVAAEIEVNPDGTYGLLLIHRKYSERDEITREQLDAEMKLWHRGWPAA